MTGADFMLIEQLQFVVESSERTTESLNEAIKHIHESQISPVETQRINHCQKDSRENF